MCLAKITLDDLIIDKHIRCYTPEIVPKTPEPTEDLDDRMIGPLRITPTLKIDPDKLHYVASQHTGECFWDTFQNILMFADGYRDVNVKFIMDDYRENPRDFFPVPYETDDFKAKIGKFYGTTDQNLINFLAGTFLRYINIKSLEKEIDEKKTSIPLPTLQRAPSRNVIKGIDLAEIGEQICPTYWNPLQQNSPKLYSMLISMKPFKNKIIINNTKYKGIEYTEDIHTFKLIGVHMSVIPDDKSDGHALGIIRFKDKFYLLDDNIGYAVDINKYIIAFNGYNFVMKYMPKETIYLFAGENIFIAKDRPPLREIKIYSQKIKHNQIFQYMRT